MFSSNLYKVQKLYQILNLIYIHSSLKLNILVYQNFNSPLNNL